VWLAFELVGYLACLPVVDLVVLLEHCSVEMMDALLAAWKVNLMGLKWVV